MKRSLLANFKPSLQVQIFLSTLFRLKKQMDLDPFEWIRPEKSFWHEDLGLLHQLKSQVKNLMDTYPLELLYQAFEKAIIDCQETTQPDFSSLFQLTAEFIANSHPEENLYFFLLRHQEDCKNTFGRLFLFNLFNKKGLKEIEQFLHDKYQERGFFHLKPSISTYLEGLNNASKLLRTDSIN